MTSDNLNKLFWVLHAAIQQNNPHKWEERILSNAMHTIMLMAYREHAKEEAVFIRLCHKCQTEIDTRKERPIPYGAGYFVHAICPTFRPREERDI